MGKVKSVCITCSKEFLYWSSESARKFCNNICYTKSRNKPIKKECSFCKKPFFLYLSNRKQNACCSYSCKTKLRFKNIFESWENKTQEEKLFLLKERYETHVIKNNGCWDWRGAKVLGYGVFKFARKQLKAHRISWLIHKGLIPDGMHVLHKCLKTRHCSNPDHLYLGTALENNHDIIHAGDRKKCLKLGQVFEIRKLIELGVPASRIATQFKIGAGAIKDIKYKRTWKHV